MSRDLQNLLRLRGKMRDRYGGTDELVQQLERDIAAREVLDSRLLTPAAMPATRRSGWRSNRADGAAGDD